MKQVTVTFLYSEVKGKDDDYYKNLAFDEIYDGDDVLQGNSFEVEDIGE